MRRRLGIDEGRFLVRLARRSIEEYLSGRVPRPGEPPSPILKEPSGVFVSLYRYPSKELRGCIGFPLPTQPLVEATVKAAIASATEDPRFPPVTLDELKELVVEVSVLTPPEEVRYERPEELLGKITVGRDGLIIEAEGRGGLLLPQVPVEYGWSAEEFLTHLCIKAGLPPTYWVTGKARILRFSAQVFAEKEPGGEVVEEELASCRRC